jgi:hypothetical protein
LRFEDGSVRELGGADPATTNNRMELTAALALLRALHDLPRHPALVIRTDSRYLIDGLERWIHGWKRKGWRTASGGPVLNRDLWEELDAARLPDVRFQPWRTCSAAWSSPIAWPAAATGFRWWNWPSWWRCRCAPWSNAVRPSPGGTGWCNRWPMVAGFCSGRRQDWRTGSESRDGAARGGRGSRGGSGARPDGGAL